MAYTDFDVGDPLAVKLFSAAVEKALPKTSWFMKSGFVGKDPTKNVVVIQDDLVGKFGDQITYAVRQQLRGYSVPGGQMLKGKEQALVYLDDRIAINQQRTGVNTGGMMSNRRVPYNTRLDAKDAQIDYWGVRLDEEFIGKLTGSLGVGNWETLDPSASGFDVMGAIDSDGNALRAPSTNRQVWAGNTGSKAGLATSTTFSLDLVDSALRLVTRLQSNQVTFRKMAPLKIGGKNVWVCLMALEHAFDMKADMGARWYDLEKAKLIGGFKDSSLVQQSLGGYESAAGTVIFYSSEAMVKFNDGGASGTVEYAASLLMGQAAACFAPGDKMPTAQNGSYVKWHEETDNRGDQVVITSGLIYGISKTGYRTQQGALDTSREDFGVCALYASTSWS